MHELPIVFPQLSGIRVQGLIYTAGPNNPNWLGHAPLTEIAVQVIQSAGSSGKNTESVLELASVLRNMKADHPHVLDLAKLINASESDSQA